ncbi:gamm1 protein [Moniliophthora roreri]|nr:gamm1 protein [Moniliophthora roreri]
MVESLLCFIIHGSNVNHNIATVENFGIAGSFEVYSGGENSKSFVTVECAIWDFRRHIGSLKDDSAGS